MERIDRMLHRHAVRVFAVSFLLHWRSRLLALGHDGEKRREEKSVFGRDEGQNESGKPRHGIYLMYWNMRVVTGWDTCKSLDAVRCSNIALLHCKAVVSRERSYSSSNNMTWARIAGLLQALAAHSFLLFFSGLLIAKLTPYFSISWWYVLELNFPQLQELFLFSPL